MPSIKAAACVQSAVVPAVTATLTGIPCASTARCILLLSPLLYAPSPGCRLWLQPRGGELCNGWRQSSAIQSQDHRSGIQGAFSHIRLSRHRINRWCTVPHLPYSGGKSRHGAPVRNIQKTALINRRLSFATPPHCPLCPGRRGSSKAHASSVMSCRRCEFSTRAPPYTVLFLYLKTRVDII